VTTGYERTLVLIKPDAVHRGLIGEIISRLERKGLKMVGLKMLQLDQQKAAIHYAQHRDKPFYQELIRFITSAPVVAMVWEGPGAVGVVRKAMGATDAAQADPGTIRGDLALDIGHNLVHGSESPEAAEREVALFFNPEELVEYTRAVDRWITPPR